MQAKGEIVKIIFRSEETGYTVLDLKCDGGEFLTAVGIFPPVNEGEKLVVDGEYKRQSKFGNQFVVEKVMISSPTRLDSMRKFLSSGLIKGLGPVTADAIVDTYGLESLEKMKYPFELKKVKGISLQKATEFGSQYMKILNIQEAVMFLQSLSITIKMSLKIYKALGDSTISTVSKNPYSLIEVVDGIGFLTADKIADKVGISKNSDKRITAGIIYLLKETSDRLGNTFIREEDLVGETEKLLALDDENPCQRIRDNVEDLVLLGMVKRVEAEDCIAIMLTRNFVVEKGIAKRLLELSSSANVDIVADAEKEIENFEREMNLSLHDSQRMAVENAIRNGVAIVTGGPGTGKTTIIKCILHAFRNLDMKVALTAPTGRASKRMSEATGGDAKTIHRLLELDWSQDKTSFAYGESNKLPLDVIIVDEVSMVDEFVFYSLLKAINRGTRLVLVGDKDQLPSVGAGNILSDLIESQQFSVSNLTQIYRQTEDSQIVVAAHDINHGVIPDLSNKSKDFFFEEREGGDEIKNTVLDLCVKRLPKFLDLQPSKIQVLSPMKRGIAGVINLNKEMQKTLNPYNPLKKQITVGETTFREGDKVMQTVNNYKLDWTLLDFGKNERGVGVFNGDIGFLETIDVSKRQLIVRFEDDRVAKYSSSDAEQLTLAYAVTIHKSQGSEFDAVVVSLDANYLLLTRNLLYTAVTRAKKMVVIVGSKKTLRIMVSNNQTSKRNSLLKKLIVEEANKEELFD